MTNDQTIFATMSQIESHAASQPTKGEAAFTDYGPAIALVRDDVLPQDLPVRAMIFGNSFGRESDIPTYARIESGRGRHYRRVPVRIIGVEIQGARSQQKFSVALLDGEFTTA